MGNNLTRRRFLALSGTVVIGALVASPNDPLGPLSLDRRRASPAALVAHMIEGRRIDSVAALESAWELGADGVDLDVRASSDGELFVWHDSTLFRHPARRLASVESLTALQLDALGLLRLSEAQKHRPEGKFLIYDVKDSRTVAIGSLVSLIAKQGSHGARLWLGDAAQTSFVAGALPLMEIGLLRDSFTPAETRDYVRAAIACGARSVSIHPDGLTASAVRYAHDHDIQVYCYVRDANGYEAALDTGIDSLITDDVERAALLQTLPD